MLRLFVLAVLGCTTCVRALLDDGSDLSVATSSANMEVVTNVGSQAFVDEAFNGDEFRYSRSNNASGYLEYQSPTGFAEISLQFYSYLPTPNTPNFTVTLYLDELSIFEVTSEDILQRIEAAEAQSVQHGQGSVTQAQALVRYEVSTDSTESWYSGVINVDALKADVADGCKKSFRAEVSGGTGAGGPSGDYWSFQIGSIDLQDVADLGGDAADVCGSDAADACPRVTAGECTPVPADTLSTYYDDASATERLFQPTNIGVARSDSGVFNDGDRYFRTDPSIEGTIVYRFPGFDFSELHVTVALRFEEERDLRQISLDVRPYTSVQCKPEPSPTRFQDYSLQPLSDGWFTVEVKYGVGPLPGLNCELPAYVELSFFAPNDADIQIMAVKVIGQGTIDVLPDEAGSDDSTPLYIWLIIGGGALGVVLLLALLLWCCMCRGGDELAPVRTDTSPPGALMRPGSKSVESAMVERPDAARVSRKLSGGQVVVPVNAAYGAERGSDLSFPQVGAIDGLHRHQQGQGYDSAAFELARVVSANGALQQQKAAPQADIDFTAGYAFPGHGALPAVPKQDIFDTWQQTGLSGYQTGDEELSGPLDTRQGSWTANPPLSATVVTSPSGLSNSGMGVTAQLGMRMSELQGMQQDHERLAKGEFDTGGRETSAPEPLGVIYGNRIGVGGFGCVYEAVWNHKQVAVKVIKMPHDAKPGEDKSRMAFMEYAISGILVHENIVATHQADIRPVFLEQDEPNQSTTENSSRVGWTNMSDFLSNDDISRQMTRLLQIQEWEIRIIMEYCNMGNLKEAIRNGSLMHHGCTRGLDCARLALDVAKGCLAIHKHKIIHGDLKPHNVLLTASASDPRGWVGKIADFGLSVKIKRGEEHVSGIQHGTEGYVAPEVMTTRRMVKASDVYSFGILMWEMWHSRLYYEEYRAAVKRLRRSNMDYRPTFERHCPPEYVGLAMSCWDSRPESRPNFARIVKMMTMIISNMKDQVQPDGTLAPDLMQ